MQMISQLLKTSIALLLIAAVALPSLADDRNCPYFTFPRQEDLKNWLQASLAKIYKNKTDRDCLGTATVIDIEKGLLLTASHVARGESVYVLFPHHRDGKRYRATIAARIDQVDGEIENNGGSWNDARDIAVLKLDQPQLNVRAAEIWMSKMPIGELFFFGFNSNSATAVPGSALPSELEIPNTGKRANCTFHLREAAEFGDSGAPVVDEAGSLVGLMITSINENRAGRFVPTKCFASTLWNLLGEEVSKECISHIADKPVGTLIAMLDPLQRNGWITNLRLASAIDRAAKDENEIKRIRKRHKCPIRWAIIDRGLGMDLYDRYHESFVLSAKKKEEAEDIQRSGHKLEEKGQKRAAFTLYHAAQHCYQKFIDETMPKIDKKKDVPASTKLLFFQALKGIADVQTRLANLTGNDDFLSTAQKNAATAALLAPKKKLKGSAIAAFGAATQKAGDQQTAIEAYSAAAQLGYVKPWMAKNYDAAFMSRDNIREAYRASDYEAMGNYEGISDAKLEVFVFK